MKKIFKKNQIIITALALMIAVAGYINYADSGAKKKASAQSASKQENESDADVSSDLDPGQMVFISGSTSQFIVSAKLEREQVRAGGKENLMEIINNESLSESAKAAAVEKMVEFSDASEKEVAAELLLEAKGFTNVMVSITDKKVDVVIEKDELTDTELAQIEDIVTRKTECSISNLTITTVKAQTESEVLEK